MIHRAGNIWAWEETTVTSALPQTGPGPEHFLLGSTVKRLLSRDHVVLALLCFIRTDVDVV